MSDYEYADDARLIDLSRYIFLKRREEVQIGDTVLLNGSRWWRVTGEECPGGALELEIAGPEGRARPKTGGLSVAKSSLLVVSEEGSGLQFSNGVLLDVPWPDCDLICVKDAIRRRAAVGDPEETVHGIFARHYDADGDSYYAPADRAKQPEVKSHWLLDPQYDLILDWEPVDVADLLERMRGSGDHD